MALVAAPLAVGFTAPASAAEANHLVISEAYGGGGNGGAPYRADFVEIFNPTDNPITMTNWSIQYRSSGSTSAPAASGITTLNGTVPAKGYFLVREATGAGTTLPDLPTADVTGTIAMSGTAFQVWLANTTTAQNPPAGNVLATPNAAIVDFLGVAAGSYETATASGTANATSASRTPTPGTESDNNGADFVIGAPTPKNTTNRYPEVLPVAATNPGNKTAYQGRAMTPFTLAATDGTTPYSWSATGLPDGVNVSSAGVVSGTPTTVGSSTVTATVTDSSSPTPGTASTQFTITVAEFPVKELKTIPEIQGTGDASPLVNQDVQVKGVVTARFPDGGLNGFVIQTPGYDPATDTTPDASDGLFVYQGATPTYAPPAIGDHVTIYNGRVTEFSGLTELTVTSGDLIDTRAATAEEAVTPGTVVPGTDCTLSEDSTDCLTGAALADVREQHESELFLPTADYTVTDGYDGSPWGPPFVASSSSSNFGEIGLAANDDEPLYIPVDKANPTSDPAKWAAIDTYNNAKRISLDDGATLSISGSSNTGIAYPWLQKDYTVRVGAAVTFPKPVIFEYRNSVWKLYPQTRVQPGTTGADRVAIEQDRAQFATPDPVGGNVKIATFNMLNYFVHPVDEWVANGGDAVPGTNRTCTTYKDRNGVALTANTCSWRDPRTDPPSATGDLGPRGAATAVSLSRQEGKEVASINTMAADVMSLEEVENPVKLGYSDRDAALKRLVAALNADWATRTGEDTVANPRWAYVASPRPEAQPTILEQDAIRSAFIFNPRVISPVGRSQILTNSPSFRNAREPLAQAFRHVDGTRDDGFIVIVNHLKSKSSPDDVSTVAGTDNADAGKGAGFYNGDRVRQARALNEFAHSVAEDKGIPAVFMTGDYNAYGAEDPVRTLEAAGFTALEPENNQASYSFGGLAGSLDHVFANEAALEMVTGQTIWPINANEPVYYEYSRYNYNVADLFDGTTPFRSSDHNPEIIGIDAPTSTAPQDVDTVQVLASNDFHGRLLDDPASASAGAAAMAGAVNGLRDANPDTVFAMAGDIVGASTFESFIQNDKPTLDAMNEAGLEVSAAGNHEFDQGYEDLMGRIMAEYDATSNPEGGANWPYLAANVRLGDANGAYALDNDRTDHGYDKSNGATWWKTFPGLNDGDGIRVGFVGAVTEDLDSLVAPSAIDGLAITSVVAEVNAAADQLKASGCGGEPCDLVIELVHEGAPSPSCATIKTDVDSPFGKIVHGASAKVDAIISGHTHLKYNCKVPVAGKTIDRPVVSAGQYGSYLNQLEFDFAPDTNNLVGIRQHVLAMKDYDEDPATKTVVDAAVQVANQRGAEVLGQVAGPFKRARRVDPTSGVVENRGGESTLGNQVAEIQRWKTGADIGVMNPGGLRDDLIGTDDGPGPVTYREAANVQPFANTLVTVDLTGAQLKTLLEQQWQRDPDGNIPSRPFLRLGTSKGFTWTEDSSKAEGNRITGMWLDGVAIDPAGTYTVSANSFLAVGGDNFRALTLGTNKQDTGFTDLQATVEYLGEFANTAEGDAPLAVDYRQHGVGARVQGGPFSAGDTVTIPVDSLSMTGGGTSNVITDTVDSTVAVTLGAQDLGTFPVTSALPTTPYDIPGAATVTFPLPSGLTGGTKWFTLTGAATGTTAKIPVEVVDNRADSTVSGTAADITWGQAGSVSVTVTPGSATGTVELYDGTTKIGEGTLTGDATTIAIPAESLSVGAHTLTLKYLGDVATKPAEGSVSVTVVKASSTVSGTAADVTWGQAGSVSVTVTPSAATGTVELYDGATKLGEGTLSSGATSVAIAARALEPGSHSLTVKYLGDSHYAASLGSVSVTVVKASSTVSGTAADVTWGQAGSVSVTVTPSAATGTVELYDGATKLGEGTLSSGATSVAIAARALEPGSHSLTVKYLGDSHYAASLGSVSVTVVKASSTVSGTAADVTWGQAGSVSVTVTPSAATGMVELYDGTTKLSQNAVTAGAGTITIPANALAVGEHELTLKYLGDTHYSASESTVDVTVVKAAATVTATPTPASVVQDSGTSTIAVAVTATGTTPTGTVSAWLGGTQLATATLSNGEADLVVGPFATTGTKSIEVRYSGSGDVSAATRTVTVTVTAKPTPQPTPTTVTGTDTTIQWAKAGSVAVSVAPSAATGTVELYEGATKLGTASLSGGAASFPLAAKSLAVGTHTMVVKYLGSSTHAASQGTVTVTVTKAKPKVQVEKPDKIKAGDKAKIKVAVTAPGYRATGEVRIVLRGVGKAITVVEDLKGGDAVARIKVTRPGKYEVTVTYLGDEHTLRGEDTTNLRVK